jgi:hypothetical protein
MEAGGKLHDPAARSRAVLAGNRIDKLIIKDEPGTIYIV